MEEQTIGKRLKEARERLNLTQAKVCEELYIANVQTLSAYERDTTTPPVEALKKLAKLYNVSSDWLLFGEEFSGIDTKQPKDYLAQLVEAVDFLKMDFSSCEDYEHLPHIRIELLSAPYNGIEQFAEKWMKLRNHLDTGIIDKDDYNVLMEKKINNLVLTKWEPMKNRPRESACNGIPF